MNIRKKQILVQGKSRIRQGKKEHAGPKASSSGLQGQAVRGIEKNAGQVKWEELRQ